MYNKIDFICKDFQIQNNSAFKKHLVIKFFKKIIRYFELLLKRYIVKNYNTLSVGGSTIHSGQLYL